MKKLLLIGAAFSAAFFASTLGAAELIVSWKDNSNNETFFDLQRKTGTGAYITLEIPGNNAATPQTITHTDTGLEPNTVYVYRIRARNAVGPSSYTSAVSGKTAQEGEIVTIPIGPNELKVETPPKRISRIKT